MKNEYILKGRGNLTHWLRQHGIKPFAYEVITDYPVQTTERMGEILVVDLSGGPKLIIGDTFENHTIQKIELINKKLYITFE